MADSMPYNRDFAPENPSNAEIQKMEPQNIAAEESVIAACLIQSSVVDEVVAQLVPNNFYKEVHKTIFECICDLHNRNVSIDYISIAENLKAKGKLDAVGGMSYVLGLTDNTAALTNWKNHVEIVKRTAILRDLIRASVTIRALAYNAPDNLSEVVEEAEKTLFNVTEKRISSDFVPINTLLTAAFNELEELAKNENKITGVATGFKDIDDLFHGFRGGDLIILAARPGVGKTAFALNLATQAAQLGTSVAFMSLEMSASQLVQRVLASHARVSLSNLRSGKIKEPDWAAIVEASARLSELDIKFDDTPALSILELRAKARRELHDVKKGLIIVDYLQLMQPSQTRRDGRRDVEVAEISRGLKILAKEMDMPVIALSQLSRQVEQRGKKRPVLSDLRESGAIEQDADIVMFIDRSLDEVEAEENGRPELGRATLIVAKHRNGPMCDIDLAFNAEYTRFNDFIDASRV